MGLLLEWTLLVRRDIDAARALVETARRAALLHLPR
jgi:hypothetical protein